MSAALVVAFAVTAAGIPLPAGTRSSNGGELFPCATCRCGCDSAEYCWRSCCCHTLAGRLAWAKKNGVRPPAFALADAKRAGIDVSWLEGRGRERPGSPETNACCTTKANNDRPTCCQARHEAVSPTETVDHVIGWRALACGGQTLHWLATVPTLILVPLELSNQHLLVAWLGPTASDDATGIDDTPSVPPPEQA